MPHRLRRGDPWQRGGEDAPSQCHHLGGRPVTNRKADQAPIAPARHMGHQLFPGRGRPWAGRLSDVADKGHGTRQRATAHHAQFHRGKILNFVDNDVAKGPVRLFVRRPRALRAEQPARLVEKCDVGLRPADLLEGRAPRPVEEVELGCAEDSFACQLDQRLSPEEVVQQGFGSQPGPHSLQQFGDQWPAAEFRTDLGGAGASGTGVKRVPRDLPRRRRPRGQFRCRQPNGLHWPLRDVPTDRQDAPRGASRRHGGARCACQTGAGQRSQSRQKPQESR